MRRTTAFFCFLALSLGAVLAQSGYPYTQVPFTSVKITPNTFWGDRISAAREVTIPLAFSKCESEHRYKTIEGASYVLQTFPDEKMKAYIDSVLDVVGAAQESDGKTFSVTAITAQTQEGNVKLIPYYAWNHRGAGKMDVWIKQP